MNQRIQPIIYSPLYKSLHDIEAKHIPLNNNQTNLILSDRKPKRSINVSGHGELSLPPDRARLIIIIKSVKEQIIDAKNSVNRRYEYIYQTIRKHKIPESLINVSKTFNKIDEKHEVITEIAATFDDFAKFQQIYNLLNEKLDSSVKILLPVLFHSQNRLEGIKYQASLLAVKNAKRLAHDIAKSFHMLLGKPVEINEESCKERYGIDNYVNMNEKSISQLIDERTITISVNLNVTFELIQSKKKEN